MAEWWDDFRRQMPVAEKWAYFDHAAVAPLSGPAARALSEWASEIASNGDANSSELHHRVVKVRQTAARLLGCADDEIAFVPNTSTGLSLVAESFPWRPGDNVVLPVSEFPSNILPWRNLVSRGVEVRGVPCLLERLETDQLLAATDSRTRIVTISWVGYVTGWRSDLDELAEECHRRGILLCVDAIQGLGILPLDLSQTPVDFLVADGHKWLLGPEGAGLLFIRHEQLDQLRPACVGWSSLRSAGNFDASAFVPREPAASARTGSFLSAEPLDLQELKSSAARFEAGSANVGGILALGASIDLLLSFGISTIWSRLKDVSERLREILRKCGAVVVSSTDERRLSGIVACELPGRSTELIRQLALQHRVVLNRRGGFIRLSPHAYSNADDLEKLQRAFP